MNKEKPILITGVHRSGSTWVGEVISTARGIGYIHEPLNKSHGKCICGFDPQYWYPFPADINEQKLKTHFDHLLRFTPEVWLSDIKNKNYKKLAVNYRRGQIDLISRLSNHRPLIKDPLALFSAKWINDNYASVSTIVTIRHPAAFVNSLMKKNWHFPFKDLSDQKKLINGPLSAFKKDIEYAAKNTLDLIDQGSLLWNITHYFISLYKQEYSDKWLFKRHEDLSRNPTKEFKEIFEYLSIEMSPKSYSYIIKSTQGTDITSRNRDSEANIKKWKTQLSNSIIDRIKTNTHSVSSIFYDNDDW